MYRLRQLAFLGFKLKPNLAHRISTTIYLTRSLATSHEIDRSTMLEKSIEKRLTKQEFYLGETLVVDQPNQLEELFIKANTIDNVKELIRLNVRNMDEQCLSECFQSIRNILAYSSDKDAVKFDLLSSKEFELVIKRTLRLVRHLDPMQTFTILKTVDYLGISLDTVFAQSLLQMIRYSINEYSVMEMHFLTKLIRRHPDRNSLLEAIALALPIAFCNAVAHKEVNFHHIPQMINCLEIMTYFGVENFQNLDAVDKCLYYASRKVEDLTIEKSLHLLTIMYDLNIRNPDLVKTAKNIINKCVTRITEANQLESLSPEFFIKALLKMNKDFFYYDRRIFNIISEKVNHNLSDISNEQLYSVLKQNWHFKYVNHQCLRHFANLIAEKNENIFCNERISLLSLLRFFTLPSDGHKIHENMELICENVRMSNSFKHDASKFKDAYFYYLKYCLQLGVNPNENLVKDWISSHLKTALMDSNINSKRHLFVKLITQIYQGLLWNKQRQSTQMENYLQSNLSSYVDEYVHLLRNELSGSSNPVTNHIYSIVARQLNSESNLKKNFVTDNGIHLDLWVEIEDKFAEKVMKNRKISASNVGIIFLSRRNYCRDPNILDGDTQFEMNILEQMNLPIVYINLEQFEQLTDAERETFILNEIRFCLKEYKL